MNLTAGYALIKIAVTAALYFLGSMVGLSLMSPISIAAFFWPSAGLALACLFLFGPIATVGIVIGAFLSKFILLSDHHFLTLLSSVAPALQAYLAYFVLKRLTGTSFYLISEKNILKFFLFTPILAVISPSLSVAALVSTHAISADALSSTWLIWWVGDIFGILIVTPLFLSFFYRKKEWQCRQLSVGVPILVLLVISVQVLNISLTQEHKKLNQRLTQLNQIYNSEVSTTLSVYEKNLQALNIFFINASQATQKEISDFLSKLNVKHDDNIYGYGWFGFADLIDKNPSSQYSFFSLKPYQYKLLELPITVIQQQYEDCNIGSYLEIYGPVEKPQTLYRNIEASITGIDNLCASEHLSGIAYVDIDLNRLFEKTATKLNLSNVSIEIVNTNANTPSLLFSQRSPDHVDFQEHVTPPSAESLITYKNTFWQLRLTGFNRFITQNASWNTWALFSVSLLLTAISCLGLLILTARQFQTDTKVSHKTRQLQMANTQMSEQIQFQNQTQILINMQSRILEMIAKEESLSSIFNQLCLYAENQIFEGATASIIKYDMISKEIELVAAPSMSEATKTYYKQLTIHDFINPSIAAIKTNQQQINENFTDTSPSLSALEVIHAQHIQAYWATPIQSRFNQAIGVFTLTHTSEQTPNKQEQQLMSAASTLASIAFERHANTKELYKLSEAVKSSPNGIVITSKKGVIEYANPFFCNYIGVREEALLGHYLSDFVQDASDQTIEEFDWDYSLTLGESQREYMGKKPNGDIYWCKQTIAAMQDGLDGTQHVLSIHQDITNEYNLKQTNFNEHKC